VDQPELLDVGADSRSSPARPRRWVLVGGAAVVVVAGVVLDHRISEREEHAVGRCAEEVETAVDRAGRRVQATYEYVRPALTSTASRQLENGLFQLIAESAKDADAPLLAVRDWCGDIDVLPFHRRPVERRDLCLDVLDGQEAGLSRVARDGATVMSWLDLPRGC
jgi:hypothetical protein